MEATGSLSIGSLCGARPTVLCTVVLVSRTPALTPGWCSEKLAAAFLSALLRDPGSLGSARACRSPLTGRAARNSSFDISNRASLFFTRICPTSTNICWLYTRAAWSFEAEARPLLMEWANSPGLSFVTVPALLPAAEVERVNPPGVALIACDVSSKATNAKQADAVGL